MTGEEEIAKKLSELKIRKPDILRKGSRTWCANNIQFDNYNHHLQAQKK